MKEAVVEIERMAFGGAGIGRVGGKACFVPLTAPGDQARILVKLEKRSHMEGELLEILHPSPSREAPPCPVFGQCGGCDWQHLTYRAQLDAKQEIFVETLRRIGRMECEQLLPIIPAPEPYGYRSRVQFKLRYARGRVHIGFFRAGSHFVVDLPRTCAVAHPRINQTLTELRRLLPDFPEPDKVPQIDVAVGAKGESNLILHYIGGNGEDVGRFLSGVRSALTVDGLFLQTGRKATLQKVWGLDDLRYAIPATLLPHTPETELAFGPGGFAQVNQAQNLALIETVWHWAGLTGTERVLDLYCGNGNFSLPLSRFAREVVGLEDFAPSIASARENCRANGMANARFICSEAAEGVRRLAAAGERFDLVILDPPRSGAMEVVKEVAALGPHKVLYVSCDPATLARDIGLLRKYAYIPVKSRPVDMFPQTFHIESVTLLEKR